MIWVLWVLAAVGVVALCAILGGLVGILFDTRRERRPAVQEARRRAALDPIADMVETKANIRTDELLRWAEAWRRAALLPELRDAIREINIIERDAVAADRERRRKREILAREEARVLEQQERERLIREAAMKAEAEETARREHEQHLADRRARYAERKRLERTAEMRFPPREMIR